MIFPLIASRAMGRLRALESAGPGSQGLLSLPEVWLRRLRHRNELAWLDDRQLLDAGLDPNTVRREIAKPFWRA